LSSGIRRPIIFLVKTSDFDYYLPPELIAQSPIEPRDHSRLMVVNRSDGTISHHKFFEVVDYLRSGDVLVFNDSRVIPARLNGRKVDTGGMLEVLLLRRLNKNVWEALVRPARRAKVGTRIEVVNEAAGEGRGVSALAEVIELGENGIRVLHFSDEELLSGLGRIALPPYIRRHLDDPERYQTVYADESGSIAAPTAGLHFTRELIEQIRTRGVHCLFVTLHIGLDTFRPVREDNPLEHPIHREYGVVSEEVARHLRQAREEGRRVICVGTTTVRLVEAAAQASGEEHMKAFQGWTELFILPGFHFQMTDGLITNFHLPRSTLLMMVSAFGGGELIGRAYKEAIAEGYRFYSFGDAMLVL
jgi:S-adenosylmethionine:tRNA ribosyltransferase-isomerase